MGVVEIPVSAGKLRRQLSALNIIRAERYLHEATYGATPNVIYAADENGEHGNFIPASYKRIQADANWRCRLCKAYTASERVPRRHDRSRAELGCANSSDALLMNIFCYPRVTHAPRLCAMLGIDRGVRPEFGVRARIAMQNGEVDRTELDMHLGPLLVEAKLTETGFGSASFQRVRRYLQLDEVFDVGELPQSGNRVLGYQLIRGVLAACSAESRFVLLCDGRRSDLQEIWFRVLSAVRSCEVRSRMALLSWQEVASCTPSAIQKFLSEKYGISAHHH